MPWLRSWSARACAVAALAGHLRLFAEAQDEAAAEPAADEESWNAPGADTTPTPGVTTTIRNATLRPDYYECDTRTCSKFDKWVNVSADWENATSVCDAVLDRFTSHGGFAQDAPGQCKTARIMGFSNWAECKQNYCKAFEEIVDGISHMGGPMFYGADKCEPLLAFNRTICEEDYRDAEAFCDCICPTLELFESDKVPDDCEQQIFNFLILGRKSPKLAEVYPVSADCSRYICDYFELIGDPLPPSAPKVVGGVPGVCHGLDLPFRAGQCRKLLTSVPYEPCPWFTPHDKDDELMCTDGFAAEVDIRNIDSWGVCTDGHNYRKQCPANYPVMCSDMNCVGEGSVRDACCQTSAEECRSGEARKCSEALVTDLPEWHGLLTPNGMMRRVTTTTLDQLQLYNLNTPTTTYAPSIKDEFADVWPWVFATMGLLGLFGSVAICVVLARIPHDKVSGLLLGMTRTFVAYKGNRITIFPPSGEVPEDKRREELPHFKMAAEMQAEKGVAAATLNLEAAYDACLRVGHNNLISLKDPVGPVRCEQNIRSAMTMVYQEQLHFEGRNLDIIEFGERWLRTLEGERDLMQMYMASKPELEVVRERVQPAPNGKPWMSTGVGRLVDEQRKAQTWNLCEQLRESIRRANEVNAGEALVREANNLLAQIIARMKDLPADRCVLDPGGEGVKLLPQGTQRALYLTTGDPYLYRPDLGEADEAGEMNLPREDLGDVSVDEARPVCAEWIAKKSCRAGKRCPWRHCAPKRGDAVRESFVWDD